jgi:hypothetical protein
MQVSVCVQQIVFVVRVGKSSGGKKGFEFLGESVPFDARCLLETTQSVSLTLPDDKNFPVKRGI